MKRIVVCLCMMTLLFTAGTGLLAADKPLPHPCARGYSRMVYDWQSGMAYLFGGGTEVNYYQYTLFDVWSFNTFTQRWKKLFEDTDGSYFNAFQAEAQALDPRSKKILIYSNFIVPDLGEETWLYDIRHNTLENVTSGTEPPGRWGSRMVYDTESRRAILFGGSDNYDFHTYNETWAYDLKTNTWTNMNPALSPPPHHYCAMVYLPFEDRVLMFGGCDTDGTILGDTWCYDFNTNTWTNMNPANAPSPRIYHTLEWDVASNQAILFGGVLNFYEPVLDETWTYNLKHNEWTKLEPRESPSARAWHSMTGTWRGILMFGGSPEHSVFTNDDTWIYKSYRDSWKKIEYK
jgi:hypothetical protein